jgi:predicted RNase H-like HicB family nuclease
MAAYEVKAHWDPEARVWWAESKDIPGLVAEADTFDGILQDLREIVPELIRLNLGGYRDAHNELRVQADPVEEVLAVA